MYRVFRNLASGHRVGDILLDGEIRDESVKILLKKKILGKVEAPPIEVEERDYRLLKVGG